VKVDTRPACVASSSASTFRLANPTNKSELRKLLVTSYHNCKLIIVVYIKTTRCKSSIRNRLAAWPSYVRSSSCQIFTSCHIIASSILDSYDLQCHVRLEALWGSDYFCLFCFRWLSLTVSRSLSCFSHFYVSAYRPLYLCLSFTVCDQLCARAR